MLTGTTPHILMASRLLLLKKRPDLEQQKGQMIISILLSTKTIEHANGTEIQKMTVGGNALVDNGQDIVEILCS